MPRFSANLGFLWADLPLLDRIDAAARAGFRAVELHWPYDVPALAVREACGRHGLTLLGVNSPVGDPSRGEAGLGALRGREADFLAAMEQSIRYCGESGATTIHALAGLVRPDEVAAASDVFVANLAMVADDAAAAGLTILLEPLNRRDRPDYLYATLEPAAAIIARTGKPNIKLMFDVYHVGVSEGDVLRKLEQYLSLIGHIQIAAVPSRAEPDEGEIDYRYVLRAIDSSGYRGWVGCEYRPRASVEAGLGWVEAMGFGL